MKMTSKCFITLCILLFTISGCSDTGKNFTSDDETAFLASLPTTDVNQSLQLSIEGGNKSFRFGSEILLVVNNLSSNLLVLDGNTLIKLLSIQDNGWVEIGNEMTYSGEKILSPKGTPLLDIGSILIQPTINSDEEIVIRAVVVSEFMKDNIRTGDFAAAYIDLYLIP